MYVGIAPPPSGRRAYTGQLVVIKERAAEEEHRGNEGDRPERGRLRESSPRDPLPGEDSGREWEGGAPRRRAHRQGKRQPGNSGRFGEDQARRGGNDTQGKGLPEAAPVEPDR